MADRTAKNGIYVDTTTGKVVEKEPESGIQLVAPGGAVTETVQAMVDRHKADEDQLAPLETATTDPGEERDGPEVCEVCGFEAKNARGLASHQRTHEDGDAE